MAISVFRAFSSEVGTGSREENATGQNLGMIAKRVKQFSGWRGLRLKAACSRPFQQRFTGHDSKKGAQPRKAHQVNKGAK
jgi:hypothetical protein